MELSLIKYLGKDQKQESSYHRIVNFKPLVSNHTLLLVGDGEMDNDGVMMPHHEIFKVQFIASCRIEMTENVLLIAFYIGEGGDLYPYVISGLPNNYYMSGEHFLLVDYKSYLEICSWTGETVLPLYDFIKEIKAGSIGINTFLNNNSVFLNRDEQQKFFSASIPV